MMGGNESCGDDWVLACSDDELSKSGEIEENGWTPNASELEILYKIIEKNGTLLLDWRCPGRRLPSPLALREDNPQEVQSNASTPEKSNFDFKDEMGSLTLRVRREGEDTLRGSAKKKTSSFDGIVSNIIRHKRIQQMEEYADKP